MSGQRASTSAVDSTARCGRRCHGRQYSDAAGAPPHPLTPSVLSAEAAHQSFRTASWGNWVFNASIRVQLRSGIDARCARNHRVSRETPGDRPITRRPGSHVAARQNHTARPIPHGAAAGFPGGLHRSHHSHAVPVPSRQTQQETEQGSSAPQRHLRPHTLDVHCPQMLSTYQHRRSLVTTSRRLLASSTTCLCIHWGHTTALPHWRLSFSAHRNAQPN